MITLMHDERDNTMTRRNEVKERGAGMSWQWLLVLAVAAGMAGAVARAENVTWTGAADQDWGNADNWSTLSVPTAGDQVIIDASAAPNTSVLLSAATPWLGSLTLSDATVTLTNWTTAIRATNVLVKANGKLTLPPAFAVAAMSNRVWVVCSNLTVAAGGLIDVDGRGSAEKSGPGAGASSFSGSGGGYGGRGGRSRHFLTGGGPYGAIEAPEAPGSGGGKASAYAGGGHGGGAVRIEASGTVVLNGTISANGISPAHTYSGGGSGGGIYITCHAFGGTNGLIRANGGASGSPTVLSSGGSGGGGRIAVHYASVIGQPTVRFATQPPTQNQKGSLANHWPEMAQQGTVYLTDAAMLSEILDGARFTDVQLFMGTTSWTVNSLTVSNCSLDFADSAFHLVVNNDLRIGTGGRLGLGAYLQLTAGLPRLDCGGSLIATNGGALHVYSGATNGVSPDYGALVSFTNDIRVASGSWIYAYASPVNGGTALFRMRDLLLAAGGGINADARGYLARTGPGKGTGGTSGAGAGYGGQGGRSRHIWPSGGAYGTAEAPNEPGSGGGCATDYVFEGGSYGGGCVRIQAVRDVWIDGTISANGANVGHTYNGGGSGGGIHVVCGRNFGGAGGLLQANGGTCSATGAGSGGSGGGGRIAVFYGGVSGLPTVRFAASCGTSGYSMVDPENNWRTLPEIGTLVLSDTALLAETLNSARFTDVRLFMPGITSWEVNNLLVENCSLDLAGSGFHLVVSNDLRIGSGGVLGLGSESAATGTPRVDVGGNLVLTNGGALRVYSGATEADFIGARVNVTNDIQVAAASWIHPYSHKTSGASVLLRTGNLTVSANGGINANAKGYTKSQGPGAGTSSFSSGSGGGHGGNGGRSRHVAAFGAVNGATNAPVWPGSGGGGSSENAEHTASQTDGGGVVRVEAAGEVRVDGVVTANGSSPLPLNIRSGGGSGGAIFIACKRFFGGNTGQLLAKGGGPGLSNENGGGGGGGRIAVWVDIPADASGSLRAGGLPSGVIATEAWPYFAGSHSVTNGLGTTFYGLPLAAPGTVRFLDGRPRGTTLLLR